MKGARPLERWDGAPVESWRTAWGVPRLEVYASIGSTNDRALELAADASHAFAVVIADEQTAGRGRRGAGWHSPPGSGLWMSVVLPWSRPAPFVTLVIGLAAAEAVEMAAGDGVRIGLKWPNDLYVGGRKLGGVLCESAGAAAVAGLGINLRPVVVDRATSLEAESGRLFSASVLAGSIVASLKRCSAPVGALDGATLAGLGARDALAGQAVETDEQGPGTARGIDRDGALVLERPDGSRVRVGAGSVRLL